MRAGDVSSKDCTVSSRIKVLVHDRDPRWGAACHNGLCFTAHVVRRGIVVLVNVDVPIGRHAHAGDGVRAEPVEGEGQGDLLSKVVVVVKVRQHHGVRLASNCAERRAADIVGCPSRPSSW